MISGSSKIGARCTCIQCCSVLCGSEESRATSGLIGESRKATLLELLRPQLSAVPRDFSWALGKVMALGIAEVERREREIPGAYTELVEKHLVELQIAYFVSSFCIFLNPFI